VIEADPVEYPVRFVVAVRVDSWVDFRPDTVIVTVEPTGVPTVNFPADTA
jgi:hypothetical protein